MSNYIASHCDRQEIEQKITEIKSMLEKGISSFEKYILSDMLKKCENALLELEKRMRNDEQICEQSENAGVQQGLGLQEE